LSFNYHFEDLSFILPILWIAFATIAYQIKSKRLGKEAIWPSIYLGFWGMVVIGGITFLILGYF